MAATQSAQAASAYAQATQAAADAETGHDDHDDSATKQVFANYSSSICDRGIEHPGDIAESSSLCAIALPPTTYPLWDSIPAAIVDAGKLSRLQLEGVMYACTKHCQLLPSGQRAGFFLGDGAGVGKGRQVSGIIIDNYARGRRKHVWFSTSSDLHLDAERDLRDLGCHVHVINNCQAIDKETRALGLSKDFQTGVLFMTYATLVGNSKGRTRMQQVVDWLGGPSFDGCLVFDECHKAKNFTPGKEGSSTKVAAAVIEIQNLLPMARVVYCSATGASEVGNMAYLSRMGLWGVATAFPDFDAFLESMKRRGVSFMEMLAMEMKAEGKYVARGLSFRHAEFTELEAELTDVQEQVYDTSVAVWQQLKSQLDLALLYTGGASRELWKPYWSGQQRFFKLLCISMKIPTVVAAAKQALAEGMCVVIGLQSTGEAASEAMNLQVGYVTGFVSPTRELLMQFVQSYFPVLKAQPPGAVDNGIVAPSEVIPECIQMRDALLASISALTLPPNFLDLIIDQMGGTSKVTEMTGRKGRIVRDARGHFLHELRAKGEGKLVAVISDAASTGISLHASLAAVNQRRRLHLTIELPWSADKAIQQLGRSHRSNQASAPIYKLVTTKIGGEKRFAAAVARRLQSMGALTRGDRRAASGVDLSEQNFDCPVGRRSLRRMYDHIVLESGELPKGVTMEMIWKEHSAMKSNPLMFKCDDSHIEALLIKQMHEQFRQSVDLMGVGMTAPKGDTVAESNSTGKDDAGAKEAGDVRRFLNRILGLCIQPQNLLFNYFAATLSAEIHAAKLAGKWSEGLSDLRGSKITPIQRSVLWVDPSSQLATYKNLFNVDRGMSFQEAASRLERERVPGDDSGFWRSKRPLFNGRHTTLLALQKLGTRHLFNNCRPATGDSPFELERVDLTHRFTQLKVPEDAEEEWTEAYDTALTTCSHGAECKQGPSCSYGKRVSMVTVLSGSVVRVWGTLEAVLARNEHRLSRTDRTMRAVRVELEGEGKHLVGVRFPEGLLPDVIALLQAAQQAQAQATLILQNGQPRIAPLAPTVTTAMIAKMVVTQPPTPIDPKALAVAFRAPVTMLDFFKPVTRQGTPAAPTSAKANPAAAAAAAGRVKVEATITHAHHPAASTKRTAGADVSTVVGVASTAQHAGKKVKVESDTHSTIIQQAKSQPQAVDPDDCLIIVDDSNDECAATGWTNGTATTAARVASKPHTGAAEIKSEGTDSVPLSHNFTASEVNKQDREHSHMHAADSTHQDPSTQPNNGDFKSSCQRGASTPLPHNAAAPPHHTRPQPGSTPPGVAQPPDACSTPNATRPSSPPLTPDPASMSHTDCSSAQGGSSNAQQRQDQPHVGHQHPSVPLPRSSPHLSPKQGTASTIDAAGESHHLSGSAATATATPGSVSPAAAVVVAAGKGAKAPVQLPHVNGVTGSGGDGGKRGRGLHRASVQHLEQLCGMGFGVEQAKRALWMANGSLERAAELCLSGQAS
ncbi:MAG: hypothetical protein WDW38_005303 [Sanguina aurantia]